MKVLIVKLKVDETLFDWKNYEVLEMTEEE